MKTRSFTKIWSLFVVLFMAIVPVSGAVVDEIDKLPYNAYFTDIKFDAKKNELCFTDTYKSDEYLDRLYVVNFFYRTEGTRFLDVFEGNRFYTYGMTNGVYYMPTTIYNPVKGGPVEQRFTAYHSKGEYRVFNINASIDSCLKSGEGRLLIAIQGIELPSNKPFESEQTTKKVEYGCYLNNYVEVNLTNFIRFEVTASDKVYYGEDCDIDLRFQGVDEVYYSLERLSDNRWVIDVNKSGHITMKEAREGVRKYLGWKFNYDHQVGEETYRIVIKDPKTNESDTSEMFTVEYYYSWLDGGKLKYHKAGDEIVYPKPADCMAYKMICSLWSGQAKEDKEHVLFHQPQCNVELLTVPKTYVVKFLNSDYTLLKIDTVNCGEDAVAPENPKMGELVFRGWSRDITNVRKDMSVVAQYEIGAYVLEPSMTAHTNEENPFEGFAESTSRAMIEDVLTFAVQVQATAASTVSYQTARWDRANKKWSWSANKSIAEYTAQDAAAQKLNEYTQSITVGINNYQEMPFESRLAVRFVLSSNGDEVYSEPYEFDIYYPTYIRSKIDSPDDPSFAAVLQTLNSDGDVGEGTYFMMPLRYEDSLRVLNGTGAGGCLQFTRVKKPSGTLVTDVNDKGEAYFCGIGETETIEVRTSRKVVWFDGTKEKHSYDFSAQGLGKYPNAYYAEIVNCGGSIKNMPENPTWEGRAFMGWKNETVDEYSDDAYLNVPAVDGVSVQFTAQWEDPADPIYYTVSFYAQDGTTLLKSVQVESGSDAEPPVAPTISGYHFIGWSGSYKIVLEDRLLVAKYGQDNVQWTVTYMDGNEVAGTEVVEDGYNANGVLVSHPGKIFIGWDKDLRDIHADITTNALYEDILYKVVFRVEGQVVKTVDALYGTLVKDIQPDVTVKEPTKSKYYTFEGWDPNVEMITGDVTLDAVIKENPVVFIVTFLGWESEIYDVQVVPYGEAAYEPAAPKHEGYVFVGWDKDFSVITEDITINALFEVAPDEAIDVVSSPEVTEKVLREGHMYILRGGKIYDVTGVEVE